MATDTLPAAFIAAATALARSRGPKIKLGLLRRLFDAILESQMRRAHRDIARILGPGALATTLRAQLPPER